MMNLRDLPAAIEARKVALGLTDTPSETDSMRNAGGQRTPEKRELLRRAQQRADQAGIVPGVRGGRAGSGLAWRQRRAASREFPSPVGGAATRGRDGT